jgi:hypothetical protein
MKANHAIIATFLSAFLATGLGLPRAAKGSASSQEAQPTVAKKLGTIKAINGNAITLAGESGPEVAITVAPNAKIAHVNPGSKDLTPIQLSDLQVGDTVRVRGYASLDGKTLNGLEVIVITRSAVAAVSDQMKQDWQKRGIGGIVNTVDPSAGTVTISIPSFAGEKKLITVHANSNTIVRRYAPDSANFEAAKPSTLQAIHVNDQLRARGDRSADGNDFTAAEIVSGTFPYVEGTVKSVDASAGTISVQDVLSKKTVQLKVTSDSQLHQIPADMAQRMAFILKRAKDGNANSSAPNPSNHGSPNGNSASYAGSAASGGMQGGAGGTGSARAGGGGLQRMLDSAPAVTLADLHKGDALAILATEGALTDGGTIVKLYSGVEPILEAAPNTMTLAPWSLGGAPGGDAGSQ